MKTPRETMDAITGILVRNKEYIDSLAQIQRDVSSYVDTYMNDIGKIDLTYLTTLQMESYDLDKKIKDNLVTLQDFIARAIMTPEFYREQANVFLKRVSHISNTLPANTVSGIILPVTIVFANMGMFYSWTLDKGIFLNVILMDSDNNIVLSSDFVFDPTLVGNEPGDEVINGDYMKNKTFNVILDIPACPIGEYTFVMTVKDPTYSFYDYYKPAIQIV